MDPFLKEIHAIECEIYATLKAIPEWKEAYATQTGAELVKSIYDIGAKYGVSMAL